MRKSSFVFRYFLPGTILLWMLWQGCAPRVRKPVPQPEAELPQVPRIRVALEAELDEGALAFQGTYQLKSEEATYLLDQTVGEFRVKKLSNKLVLYSPKRNFEFTRFQEIRFVPRGEAYFVWNDRAYQGEVLFVHTGQGIAVVNELPLTEYLQGVVPNEIPSHTRDYLAAIEAQTIAARSYALYYLQHPESPAFHLYDDVRHQVYRGRENQSSLVQKAIQETAGLVLTDEAGRPIRSEFHSTCGGYLEAENGTTFTDGKAGSFYCSASPFYRWMRTVNDREILRNLLRMGRVKQAAFRRWMQEGFKMHLRVEHRTASGRVDKLLITINGTRFVLKDWEIRKVLAPSVTSPLPGNLFFLKKSRAHPGQLYVIGAGYGHGRGMCQWGAIGQALQGKSYRDILNFYYPNSRLKRLYQ